MLGLPFGWRYRVRKLRKRWDRLREKSLKKKGVIKATALERLDAIENNLRIIEERKLSMIERSRISKDIEISLAEVKALLKTKPEEFEAYRKRTMGEKFKT